MRNSALSSTALQGRSRSGHDELARGLGYFSIGLGLLELLAPGALCRSLGLEGRETLVRAYGARELATGVAILASHDATPWIWGRVAGDGLDLATLVAAGQGADHQQRRNLGVALAAVAGVTALDVICARGLTVEKGGRSTATADYSDRSGFPKPAETMRGAARDFEVPPDMRVPDLLRSREADGGGSTRGNKTYARSTPRLRVKESQMGRIVVVDDDAGHEFAFRVESSGGTQTLGAFAPRWASGHEPVSTTLFVIEARQFAEREAIDRGWISL